MSDLQNPTPPAAPEQPNVPGVPVIDVQAEIQKAVSAQQTRFADDLKAATGFDSLKAFTENKLQDEGKITELLSATAQERDRYKKLWEAEKVANALLSASAEAVDPTTVAQLLRDNAVVAEDGRVTIDGKPVVEAVKALLTERPFLAKAQGGTGSGAPQAAGAVAVNPWAKEQWNLTQQIQLAASNPTLAAQLKAAAGK